ncbi:MAG: hypothetical protein PHV82_14660 [Victivallaceae bacterium]|nr:hypothetical protein [Victivallaceae bacterium]
MKKIVAAAIAGLMTLACGAFYAGDKKRPCGSCPPDFMKGQEKPGTCRQTDEIDELLMLVLAPERNICTHKPQMMDKCGPQQGPQAQCPMMDRGPQQGPQAQCQMMGKGGRMHHFRRGGNEIGMLKVYLQEKYPEELKEIKALKKNSDEAAQKVIDTFKKLVDKAGTEMKAEREKAMAEHKKMAEMIAEYKKSKDAKLAEQIKVKLGEFYDKRLEGIKKKLERDSARIQEEKARLEELGKNKDQEITKQLEQISK